MYQCRKDCLVILDIAKGSMFASCTLLAAHHLLGSVLLRLVVGLLNVLVRTLERLIGVGVETLFRRFVLSVVYIEQRGSVF
jgi:hypothetical protein